MLQPRTCAVRATHAVSVVCCVCCAWCGCYVLCCVCCACYACCVCCVCCTCCECCVYCVYCASCVCCVCCVYCASCVRCVCCVRWGSLCYDPHGTKHPTSRYTDTQIHRYTTQHNTHHRFAVKPLVAAEAAASLDGQWRAPMCPNYSEQFLAADAGVPTG
jgi:hypothetical protein